MAYSRNNSPEKIKVLVVDDSLFMRQVISDLLNSDSGIEVVAKAANGLEALENISIFSPDVVTLDYEMPKMNGLETLEKIKRLEHAPSVVMVSGYTQKDADITLKCLSAGAVDFVTKPSGSLSMEMLKVKEELVSKVKIAAKVNPKLTLSYQEKTKKISGHEFKIDRNAGAVVIGSSTGGPAALEALLPQIPQTFPYPVFVNQHLPKSFTTSFSQRLDKECQLNVEEGEDGVLVEAGKIYLAPGGKDMEVVNNDGVRIRVIEPHVGHETPCIDVLMTSVAKMYGKNTIGIILTGMGSDGVLGMEAIKNAGGKTLVQDEGTSVIFGMGKEVVEKGFADDIVPIDAIIDKLIELID